MSRTEKHAADATYRLELFMSVDLAGSTAFKFALNLADGYAGDGGVDGERGWLAAIEKFYQTFNERFTGALSNLPEDQRPTLWKALGDELIYRVQVHDRHHANRAVHEFVTALHHTRTVVRNLSRRLDLKACAWIADFPARNAVVDLNGLHDPFQHDAETRAKAAAPHADYIGPSMDAGFRLGKLATRRKLPLSVELAYVLAVAQTDEKLPSLKFGYDGRHDLKGVLGGETYPVLWIDIEDDRSRREANQRESYLLNDASDINSQKVIDFCRSYIASSDWLEVPYIPGDLEGHFSTIPRSIKEHIDLMRRKRPSEARLYSEEAPPGAEAAADGNVRVQDLMHPVPTLHAQAAGSLDAHAADPPTGRADNAAHTLEPRSESPYRPASIPVQPKCEPSP